MSQSMVRAVFDVSTFHDPEAWLDSWQTRRTGPYETLLLTGHQNTLSVLLLHGPTGEIDELRLETLQDGRISAPSSRGMMETLAAQARLMRDRPTLDWGLPKTTVRGKGVFVFPLGPVRADVAESLGYQFSVMGDDIIELRLQPGFKRRHIRELIQGKTLTDALGVVARFTTTSNVHHTWAFSLAIEEALGLSIPEPAQRTRMLMAELERAYSHVGDLAVLAVSTGLPVPQMEYLHLKEKLLRINFALFGHRYLRGTIVPGGVTDALWPQNKNPQKALPEVSFVRDQAQRIARDLNRTTSFLDRLHGAGSMPADTVTSMRPVGPVGRASGLAFDVRSARPYGAYIQEPVETFQVAGGDAYARFSIRVLELEESLRVIIRLLNGWKPEEVSSPDRHSLEATNQDQPVLVGTGVVEAPRGLLTYHVHLDQRTETVQQVGIATPSERNWPTVPSTLASGNILQDFPIIDASFSLSVAGWDG